MNVDFACSRDGSSQTGVGAIVRNHLSEILVALALPCIGCFSSNISKLFAARVALIQILQLGFSVDHFESNSLAAVNSINSR